MSVTGNVLCAFGGAIVGSVSAFWLSNRSKKRDEQNRLLFSIYLKVLELD